MRVVCTPSFVAHSFVSVCPLLTVSCVGIPFHSPFDLPLCQSPRRPVMTTQPASAGVDPAITTYTHTTFLTSLTDSFTSALLQATESLNQQHAAKDGGVTPTLVPEYYIEATKAALRAVLAKQYSPEVAAAYSATFSSSTGGVDSASSSSSSSSSSAATGTGSAAIVAAKKDGATIDAPIVEKKKPIRTYIDGCFDIMHSGHYNAIRQAKALTDILVVGVHSDAEILRHKGPPVMNEKERLATVRACKWVDEVVFDTPYDPSLELLIKLDCDFCVHGDDISTTADGKDAYADVKEAGRMKIVKRTEGVSTTDLVGRLLLMTKNHHLNSPAIAPLNANSKTGSPAVSSQISKEGPPSLTLEPPAVATQGASSPVRKSSDIAAAAAPRIQVDEAPSKHYSSGISNFLPTTWRITQFSNHKTPSPTDKIVYIDGAFDLFHVGHIETLKKAKDLGTFLYVGIHDDATVNLHKGKNYPIMNLHERVMNVLSCKYVDEVVIGAPWVLTKDLITTLNLHIVASGSNTKFDKDVEESFHHPTSKNECDAYAVPKEMGIFKEIETTHSLNTDNVVTRLIENRLKYENRNAKRSVKELNYLSGQKTYVAEI